MKFEPTTSIVGCSKLWSFLLWESHANELTTQVSKTQPFWYHPLFWAERVTCFYYRQVFVAGLECVGGARSAGKGKRIGGSVKWYSLIRGIVAEHFSLVHESLLSIFTIEHCRFWYVFQPISLIHWSKQPHVKPLVGTYYCCSLFGRIFTLNLTITTFYLAMAMLVGTVWVWLVDSGGWWIWRSGSLGSDSSAALQALVLVPGTNLAFRQTARNPDGSLAWGGRSCDWGALMHPMWYYKYRRCNMNFV